MKTIFLVAGIMLLLTASISVRECAQQKNWDKNGREFFINSLMRSFNEKATEESLIAVDFPLPALDEQELKDMRTNLNALSDETLKDIKKRYSSSDGCRFVSREDPLTSENFYVIRSASEQRAFVVWIKELQVPLSDSVFLTTWRQQGVYGQEELLKALLKIDNVSNEEATNLWRKATRREDEGWL